MKTASAKILDTHLHLWDAARLNYPWHQHVPAIAGKHDPEVLFLEATEAREMEFVFVQAECRQDQAVQEVEWVTELSRTYPQLKGIVAYAPMNQGEKTVQALDQLQRYPLVKGVRHHIQLEAEASFCWQPEFIRGIHSLVKRQLTFDLCLLHPQIPDVLRLVEQAPENDFILDHFANAGLKEGWLAEWEKGIKALAKFPKVFVKLSGLLTQCQRPWNESDFRRIFDVTLTAFGPKRCCFGSDWPVVKLNGSYSEWKEIVLKAISGFSEEEQQGILSCNAKKFYRINS